MSKESMKGMSKGMNMGSHYKRTVMLCKEMKRKEMTRSWLMERMVKRIGLLVLQ